jgi:ParB/RepB/Spo0J family partition protein
MSEKIQRIPLDELEVKDNAHRMQLDIDPLVESIETVGQINPIVVRKAGTRYRVIAGRRRYSALKQIQKSSGKPQFAMVVVKDIDAIQEELIFIDENLMRQELTPVEYDEALYRRKQLYEQLHPETRKNVAGAIAKHRGAETKKAGPAAFAADSAKQLKVSRRTVEKAIARAERASDAVKKAREKGELSPSKVDLLVALAPAEQNILLPAAKCHDVGQVKALVDDAKSMGAAAVVYALKHAGEETQELRAFLRDAERLTDTIKHLISKDKPFRGENHRESLRKVEELGKQISRFANFQRSHAGSVRAIVRRGGEQKRIREAFQG